MCTTQTDGFDVFLITCMSCMRQFERAARAQEKIIEPHSITQHTRCSVATRYDSRDSTNFCKTHLHTNPTILRIRFSEVFNFEIVSTYTMRRHPIHSLSMSQRKYRRENFPKASNSFKNLYMKGN